MERILSKSEIERKRKRNIFILSGAMLAILIFSTIGFAFFSGDKNTGSGQQSSGGNTGEIVKQGDFWVLTSGTQVFYFRNAPNETTSTKIEMTKTLQDYSQKTLYISSDNGVMTEEVSGNIGRFADRIQNACYGPCDKNYPEKNCTDNMIVIRSANNNLVTQKENCVFISGDLTAADAFLYRIFGII